MSVTAARLRAGRVGKYLFGAIVIGVLSGVAPAMAAPISNPVASFSGLDKITARLSKFDVYIGETVQFGSLQITPRVCYTRPADEQQRTTVFVEVDRVNLDGSSKRIFTGWMFADSPALHAVDDPLYDFWLTGCKRKTDLPQPVAINPLPGPVALPPQAATAATRADAAGASPKAATSAPPADTTPDISGVTSSQSSSAGSIVTLPGAAAPGSPPR